FWIVRDAVGPPLPPLPVWFVTDRPLQPTSSTAQHVRRLRCIAVTLVECSVLTWGRGRAIGGRTRRGYGRHRDGCGLLLHDGAGQGRGRGSHSRCTAGRRGQPAGVYGLPGGSLGAARLRARGRDVVRGCGEGGQGEAQSAQEGVPDQWRRSSRC